MREGGSDKVKSCVSWDLVGPLLVKLQEVGPFFLKVPTISGGCQPDFQLTGTESLYLEGSLQPLSPLCRDTGQKQCLWGAASACGLMVLGVEG